MLTCASTTPNVCRSPLKNYSFLRSIQAAQIGFDDMVPSTTLESNKSHPIFGELGK